MLLNYWSVLYCSEIVTLFLETVIEESLFQTRLEAAVSASAAAEEKQDNPKAAVISTAIAGIKTAAVATAAAQQ